MEMTLLKQGAEARIYSCVFYDQPCIVKERFSKKYRHPNLDRSLTTQRIKAEVRAITRCRMIGIPAPVLYMVNMETSSIYMSHIQDSTTLRDHIISVQAECSGNIIDTLGPLAKTIGYLLGKMHSHNIIHGDLTTSNMLLRGDPAGLDVVLIDFGLSRLESSPEDKGVDLYVLERAFLSSHPNTEELFEIILGSYRTENRTGSEEVMKKLDEVRMRGRKRTMVG